MYVQFTDNTEAKLLSVFGSPQDPVFYPNQGEIPEDDIRYLRFMFPNLYPLPPVLSEVSALKRDELRQACSNAITRSSFQSEALGGVYNYDCRLVDQINLKVRYDIATFTAQPEPIWASDGTRYEWKLHTASEIIAVMVDMNEHIKYSQVKLATKLAAVDAAIEAEQVIAIEW